MIIDKAKKKIYKPKFDKLYFWITAPTAALVLTLLVLTSVWQATAGWIVMAATAAFVAYFLLSPCFGYVELRKATVFVKFGFFLKREIPYASIRVMEKKRSAISDSMLALKNAMDHLNIKYNSFDCVSVSVKDEEDLIKELKTRCNIQ